MLSVTRGKSTGERDHIKKIYQQIISTIHNFSLSLILSFRGVAAIIRSIGQTETHRSRRVLLLKRTYWTTGIELFT